MQTHAVDVVREFFHAIETQNINAIRDHLSSDFIINTGEMPPLNKYEFVSLVATLMQHIPDLAFDIQNIQEDNQYPQSDRVDVDFQANGTLTATIREPSQNATPQAGQENTAAFPRERFSFTIMGDTIASIMIAHEHTSGLAQTLAQLRQTMQDEQGQGNAQWQEAHANEQGDKRYNRQSNLYDPEGKSYTPSQKELDYAPQIDTYGLSEQSKDDPMTPIFHSEQEQEALRRRDPNKLPEQPD